MTAKEGIVSHYNNDLLLCDSLNRLSDSTWGIRVLDGERSDYVPFSMLKNGHIVANISVGQFNLIVNGIEQDASMIQTVMTQTDYRRRGFIRALFEPAQAHVAQTTGRTFFLAHQDKIPFYEQFGYQHTALMNSCVMPLPSYSGIKKRLAEVDYQNPNSRAQLEAILAKREAISNGLGVVKRHWLFHWFCRYKYSESIFFAQDINAYLILKREKNAIVIVDIVAEKMPTLTDLLPYLSMKNNLYIKTEFSADKLTDQFEVVADDTTRFFYDDGFELPVPFVCVPSTQRG